MPPMAEAFERLWPQAQRMNLLDDRLSQDLAAAGSLTADMVARVVSLAQYGRSCGARGILFTCSAFGPAIESAAQVLGVPTLKPNEAMFDEALDLCARLGGARRIGLLTSFAPAGKSMRDELLAAAGRRKLQVTLDSACVSGAMDALNAGDVASHDRLIVEQAQALAGCDVLMLGQFSMARAMPLVAAATRQPVLTSPDSAVRRLQRALFPQT